MLTCWSQLPVFHLSARVCQTLCLGAPVSTPQLSSSASSGIFCHSRVSDHNAALFSQPVSCNWDRQRIENILSRPFNSLQGTVVICEKMVQLRMPFLLHPTMISGDIAEIDERVTVVCTNFLDQVVHVQRVLLQVCQAVVKVSPFHAEKRGLQARISDWAAFGGLIYQLKLFNLTSTESSTWKICT